ncbi:dienelactone hydrolase family protein [Novosphingobium sp. KCTC 2891]|uniref:dienelactone hydrolase family protein n=1 Tax=Novosphingobium sp. KCTC 2891 TaxID=2989730 RepID=UPI00222171CF|nr:dienelactone hydrolase family protein [Novosphingobium sp. KCTC 2891]MCW1384402.1 dienelactone hydrolase family protein [Novosphingobium sp. KCTC 2891]
MKNAEAFAGYEPFEFTDGPWTRRVWRKGSGPAVIVMHEMPNLHPLVLRFADRVAAQGMTVFCPSLFGEDGRVPGRAYTMGQMLYSLCVRREFNAWANGRSSPIVDWLRALARHAHGECGGKGVGAVGMCFTGGFALAMMTEPAVVAPVLSQPSLPLGRKGAGMIDASPEEIACARRRLEDEDLTMLGLRFPSDGFVPDARFAMLKDTFGDRFKAIELPDEHANPAAPIPPHSVLTWHVIDQPGTRTREVEAEVIAFFRSRTGA